MTKKIGIFSGTFDPVHKGHIAFALKAAELAGLDKVYFLPEAVPRRKDGVTHYAHRIAMLRLAIKPHKKLAVLELPDKQFSVTQSLPRLQKKFNDDKLYMLLGSDMVPYLSESNWPGFTRLLESVVLVVGMRLGVQSEQEVASRMQEIIPSRNFFIFSAGSQHASSRDIRSALRRGIAHDSALLSLDKYIRQNWLYASVTKES